MTVVNVRSILISLASLSASLSGFAQTWDGGGAFGLWSIANNWNPNAVPATNSVVNFDGDNAGGKYSINLGFADRTVRGINFIDAPLGTNPFTFNNRTLFVGDQGIVNNDNATQVFNSSLTLGPDQTWDAASGGFTFAGNISLGASDLTFTGSGTSTINGLISTSGGELIKTGTGTLLLGADNRIANATNLRLGGGTFGTGGFDETMGTLTLTADSTINFGSGASILNFADSSGAAWTGGTKLYITNWSGAWHGGGADQLFFGSAQSHLSAGQEAQVWFVNPNGLDKIVQGRMLASGEIVPVPEPATIGLGALLLGGLGWRERKRFARWATLLSSCPRFFAVK